MPLLSLTRFRQICEIVIIVTVCLFHTTSITQAKQTAGVLRCEAAKVDITPQKHVKLSGYAGRTGYSEGVHDPLSARVVAFENDGKQILLVSIDTLGFYNGTDEYLRKAILEEFKLAPSELFLCGIHTHSAPTLTVDKEKGDPNNLEYTETLKNKLIEAIRQSLDNTAPVQIGVGTGYCQVGANRRELKFDGSGGSSIQLGRNPYGTTDKEVLVAKVANPDGKPIAALFDYATHSTSLGPKNYTISGDVIGLAEQFVEKILGENAIAPGFAGASGDIDPWFRVLPGFNTESGWIPEPVLLGTLLGEEVVHTFRGIANMSDGGEIKTAFVTLELPGKLLNEIAVKKDSPPAHLNLTVARIGEIGFVGIGCEVLTEIGAKIKAASPYKHTFVITHCNGAAGYLPPAHLYVEGGYEIRSSPFAPEAADMVVKPAIKMLHEL